MANLTETIEVPFFLHDPNVLGHIEQTLVTKTVLISLKNLYYLRVCHPSFMNKLPGPFALCKSGISRHHGTSRLNIILF